jgi:hypothetical protein
MTRTIEGIKVMAEEQAAANKGEHRGFPRMGDR